MLFVCTEGETLQIASLVGSREKCFSQWFRHDRHVMASRFILGKQTVASLIDSLVSLRCNTP